MAPEPVAPEPAQPPLPDPTAEYYDDQQATAEPEPYVPAEAPAAPDEYAVPDAQYEYPPQNGNVATADYAPEAQVTEGYSPAAPVSQYGRKPVDRPSRKWLYWQIGGCGAAAAVAAIFILHARYGSDSSRDLAAAPAAVVPSADIDKDSDPSGVIETPAKPWAPSAVVVHTPPNNVHLSPEDLFAQSSPSIGKVEQLDAHGRPVAFGTGFFVSPDGLLVTNYHVLDGASNARFVMDESRQFEVEGYAAADREHDLVLLKVRTSDVPPLKVWAGDPPRVGAQVFAIGNPEGLSNTLSDGRVSGLRQDPTGEVRMVQISVPISHGSSGGPLLTDGGLVVGVTSAGLHEGQNLNFAIPSHAVDQLIHSAGAIHPISDLSVAKTRDEATRAIYIAMEMTNLGHPDEAVALLERVAKSQRENWLFWYAMGLAHEAQRKQDVAEADFSNVERLQPEVAAPWEVIGAAYLMGNKPDRAVACFGKAIEKDPYSIPGYAGLAKAEIKLGKPGDAVTACEKGLTRTGENPGLLIVLAECYVAEKQSDLSVKTFERAVKSDPQNGRALLGLGFAYKAAGKIAEARETLGKVLAADSNAGEQEKQEARRGLASIGKAE